MKRIGKIAVFAICFLASLSTCGAACHAITPSGSGLKNGSDWNNACSGFSGACAVASLVRNDTYYVGSGTYPGSTDFNTPTSGNSVVTIKGANAADHCTDTGWSAGLDTSASPAKFVSNTTWSSSNSGNGGALWTIDTSNWTFDGNNCPANRLTNHGQGILLDDSAVTPTTASKSSIVMIDTPKSGGVGNITMRCVEMKGSGMGSDGNAADFVDFSSASCNSAGTEATITLNGNTRWFPAQTAPDGTVMPASQISVTGVPNGNFNADHVLVSSKPANNKITYPVNCSPNATATSGSVRGAYTWFEQSFLIGMPGTNQEGAYTFQYVSIHDSSNSPVQINGGSPNGVFDHIYVARNAYLAPDHSAGWTFEENGGSSPSVYTISNSMFSDIEATAQITCLFGANVSGFAIYGNTFSYTTGNPFNRRGIGNGVFACINSNTTCNGVKIYNNTIANITPSGTQIALAYNDTNASNWVIENNLAYNSVRPAPSFAVTPSGLLVDYNTYLNNTSGGSDGGSHSFAMSGATNPFVNDGSFNYSLTSDAVVAHLNDGTSLPAPYNVDPNGKTRGSGGAWDRGAIQFTSVALQSPTALTVTVH
jgi:hypothetical protein